MGAVHLGPPRALTPLLDAELRGGPGGAHGADRLALVLALVVGRHAGDAQRAAGQHLVPAVLGQRAVAPRPGDDGLRVAAGLAGEVHRVALQRRLVLGGDGELGDGWVGERGRGMGFMWWDYKQVAWCVGLSYGLKAPGFSGVTRM